MKNNDNMIFALDIGTRSIVGIVAEKEDDQLKLVASKSICHTQRTMVDGQIEDIKKVGKVIQDVVSQLESELDCKLNNVYIAAAGRSLKTEKITFTKKLDSKITINDEIANQIEIEALQKAHDSFYEKSDGNKTAYYCVGYSVLSCQLDDIPITNINGHRASDVEMEIIAAFLPHIVVEGLYSSMDLNSLSVASLTLEPIAAMNLIIPSDLRLLNLALVDIGAGTSDIAVSKNGSIVGYDMATIAGDEITEMIMKNYIVDFNTAEKIKIDLSSDRETINYTDILGLPHELIKKDVIDKITPASENLAKDIADKIMDLNNEAPVAIFLIGGGSKTPKLREFLSKYLDMNIERIAIGTEQVVKNVDMSVLDKFDPEYITPIGIAYSSIMSSNYDFFSVIVNGKKVRLYNIRQMKVMDALLMSGFDSRKLMGFSGKNLSFTLNNKEYFFKGDYSTPAEISVNGSIANIETKINPGDVIDVKEAKDGISPVIKISDIASFDKGGKISFNGNDIYIGTKYMINNNEVDEDYIIGNSDIIEIIHINTIDDLIALYEIDSNYYNFFKAGEKIDGTYTLSEGDTIDVYAATNSDSHKEDTENEAVFILDETEFSTNTTEVNNTKKKEINTSSVPTDNIKDAPFITVSVNDQIIDLPKKELPYIFTDMLNYTDIDPHNPKGDIEILHNGSPASYTSEINNGDTIIIRWNNES